MEREHNRILLTVSFFSFILVNPAQAICIHRKQNDVNPHPKSPALSQVPGKPPVQSPPIKAGDTAPSSNNKGEVVTKPSAVPLGNPQFTLTKVCRTTDYPALCLSTLAPFLIGKAILGAPEPIHLLEVAIKAVAAETRLVKEGIAKLTQQFHGNAATVSTLEDCSDNYSDALDNFQAAMDALRSKDIGTINSMLSAAVTDYSTCEDEFDGESSPMAGHDNKLSHMTDNCLAIASMIK